jgi:hypothetical protein
MAMRKHHALKSAVAVGATLMILACFWFAYWTYYNPHVEVPPPIAAGFESLGTGGRASVLFLGDFAPTDKALPSIEKHGYGYQFGKVGRLLDSYDVVAANLEAPITTNEKPRVEKKYIYKINPDAVSKMRRAGIDVLTLANNHIMDYGRGGLADTLAHLDSARILHAGADLSEAGARRGLLLETPAAKLGVLAYMQNKLNWRMYYMAFALDAPFRSWPGAARLDYKDLGEDITRMKKVSDKVAVVVHWGENYRPVDRWQKTIGRAAIDLGADVVIGHHPHQAQPVELYKGKPIRLQPGQLCVRNHRPELHAVRHGRRASSRKGKDSRRGIHPPAHAEQNRQLPTANPDRKEPRPILQRADIRLLSPRRADCPPRRQGLAEARRVR